MLPGEDCWIAFFERSKVDRLLWMSVLFYRLVVLIDGSSLISSGYRLVLYVVQLMLG